MPMDAKKLRAKGDWIAQLRTILKQGPVAARKPGTRPQAERRTSKEAVTLLLTELSQGLSQARDADTSEKDINRVIFNAVETMVSDKESESQTGKNTLAAVASIRKELATQLKQEAKKQGGLEAGWGARINQALDALWIEETRAAATKLIGLDAAAAKKADLDGDYGSAKADVLAEAVLALSRKAPRGTKGVGDQFARDPELFKVLAKQIKPKQWNDPKLALGTRVCQELSVAGDYDTVCDLIGAGVDTSLPARSTAEDNYRGTYSDFIQPLQHIASKHLRDVALLDDKKATPLVGDRKKAAEGMKKVMAALEASKSSITLTSWQEVKDCELVKEFEKNPGTIWGFEDIRLPYVQAAHETKEGVQPVRMMEIWEAVIETIPQADYNRLVGSSRVDLQACKLEYSIVSPK